MSNITEWQKIASRCNEGILLGKILGNDKIKIFKTYVSSDMLFPEQNEYNEELYESLLKYRSEIQ